MFQNTVRKNAANTVTLKRNKPIPPVEQSNKNKTLFKTVVGDAPKARVGEDQGGFQARVDLEGIAKYREWKQIDDLRHGGLFGKIRREQGRVWPLAG